MIIKIQMKLHLAAAGQAVSRGLLSVQPTLELHVQQIHAAAMPKATAVIGPPGSVSFRSVVVQTVSSDAFSLFHVAVISVKVTAV